jgi:LDH2 family malate/lactate/ureidoglycolate dehydrogenase/serine/threonine protein kinase/tetratricopeptide (TPR) repeat protein
MSTKFVDWTGHTLEGRNSQYRIKSALGSGGMATVYLAVDSRTGKEVAVKLPHEQILREEGFAARFTREIKSLLRLAHPNIVKVLDIGDFRGSPFAVLQYLALGSLRLQQPLDLGDGKVWPMQPDEITGWLAPVADALDFVHTKGYVHRDVKPENIMFDAEGNAYLGDFGVIKARADVHKDKPETVATGAGLVLGTPHYMAPEVLMGEAYDGRADQYSLAVTVYELLAARVPFPGDAPVAIVGHTTRPVPKLASFAPEMPRAVEDVVLRGLSKKKEERYRDCRAFAEAYTAAVRSSVPKPMPVASPVKSAAPPPLPGRAAPPPPPSRTPSARPAQSPSGSRRGSPIVCPYCRYEVNLPDHVRSKAIRCAGCRKVYLLDAPSPSAGTAKQEQARTETRPEDRRAQARPADYRTPALLPIERRTPGPRPIEEKIVNPRRVEPEPEPRRETPASVRSRPASPPAPPPPPPPPPKPKGPPVWKQPGFRKFARLSSRILLVLLLLGGGGIGIYQGFIWYEARAANQTAALSDKACNDGHYADAVTFANSALERDSNCAAAYVSRARARYFQGDLEAAYEDLNKADELEPGTNAKALALRSAVQVSRGLPESALTDAKAAVALDPNLGIAHAYLGLAKLECGQHDGETNCDTAVQKSPEDPEVYRIRAMVRVSNAKLPQAEADMNTAVSKSGEIAFYLASRGIFSVLPYSPSRQFDATALDGRGGNLIRAQADGNNAIKKDSTCGLGHLALAAYHIRSNNLKAERRGGLRAGFARFPASIGVTSARQHKRGRLCYVAQASSLVQNPRMPRGIEPYINEAQRGSAAHLAAAYLRDLEAGKMTPTGEPEVVNDRGSAITWDGRRLPGVWLAAKAVNLAAQRARDHGIGVVAIRRSHHIGCLAAFLQRATDHGFMVIIASSDPAVASVAPYGGCTAVLTPDPIAIGIPTGGDPILIDISASITTNGMSDRLRREGNRFPGPWALDAAGEPTDDPAALFANPPGTLLPIGGLDHGHKGFGLALMIEALTQGLSGYGRAEQPSDWGASVFVQVFDPAAFGGRRAFERETSWTAAACKNAAPASGVDAVRLPGQRGLERKRQAMNEGVQLYSGIMEALTPFASKFGIELPLHL